MGIFSSDEMASDTYKCKIVDDVILEIECKMITCKPGAIDDALLGANASAEGGCEDGGDEETITGPNLVLAHRLSSTGFDKKGWTVYIKDFMKRTLKHLEENNPDRAAKFKAGSKWFPCLLELPRRRNHTIHLVLHRRTRSRK